MKRTVAVVLLLSSVLAAGSGTAAAQSNHPVGVPNPDAKGVTAEPDAGSDDGEDRIEAEVSLIGSGEGGGGGSSGQSVRRGGVDFRFVGCSFVRQTVVEILDDFWGQFPMVEGIPGAVGELERSFGLQLGSSPGVSALTELIAQEGLDPTVEYNRATDCPEREGLDLDYVWLVGEVPPVDLVAHYRDQAYDATELPVIPQAASPMGTPTAPHVVNLETFYWLDADVWSDTVSAVAGIPGFVEVTTSAVASHALWDPGDGSKPVRCAGPGIPWTKGAVTDCGYTYSDSSAIAPRDVFTLTTDVVWGVTWTCVPGCGGGTLPSLTVRTSRDVGVAELQAVLTG